jgi:hypothetical protein
LHCCILGHLIKYNYTIDTTSRYAVFSICVCICIYVCVCVHDVGATLFWNARCRAENKQYCAIFVCLIVWDGKLKFNNKRLRNWNVCRWKARNVSFKMNFSWAVYIKYLPQIFFAWNSRVRDEFGRSMKIRIRYLEKPSSKRPHTEWQWVTYGLCGCRVCSNFNGKLKYGVLFLVILCVSYKFCSNDCFPRQRNGDAVCFLRGRIWLFKY